MSFKYRVVTIVFTLDHTIPPFRIISDLERYFDIGNCVVDIKAFSGDVIACTLCGKNVVAKVKNTDTVFIDRMCVKYKIVESNIICIKVKIPYYNVGEEDLNRLLKQYANIMVSEVQYVENTTVYFCILELRRDLPKRIKSKAGYLDVVEIV
ncbi:uncharacterized protein CDAR_7301 [Caerostris darwini]|uniref:Uncharacterized protein n=1 Tax=Caerostris darwini TaxID=1538125 RepID=A0AAV4VL53_9ARAC|nr:uncharacterized protein CDAR_7301 [Caerostris darwini]